MKAFHNDEEIKDKYLKRVSMHEKADEIVKGQYWEGGKGCAVGCTIHGSDHKQYEKQLGIPMWLARVEDRVFEGLPNSRAKTWPREFLEAITPGQDLDKIKIPFLIFVVESARKNFDHKKYPAALQAIDNVLKELRKPELDLSQLREAQHAAYTAFTAAADAAHYATDAAAYAAAYAADAAVAYAADAAVAYATDNYAAKENEYVKFANKILDLIREDI